MKTFKLISDRSVAYGFIKLMAMERVEQTLEMDQKKEKIVQLGWKHIVFVSLAMICCFMLSVLIPKIPKVSPQNECLAFKTKSCDLLYVRVFQHTILTYCYTNETESLTIFDKHLTNKVMYKNSDLTKVRHFLKIAFENFGNRFQLTEHRLYPLLTLFYTKERQLHYAVANETIPMSNLVVYSMYKLLCY